MDFGRRIAPKISSCALNFLIIVTVVRIGSNRRAIHRAITFQREQILTIRRSKVIQTHVDQKMRVKHKQNEHQRKNDRVRVAKVCLERLPGVRDSRIQTEAEARSLTMSRATT